VTAPDLETARLRLRGHRREDLDACAAMWGDPLVVRYIGGRTFSREEVWARVLRHVGHWQVLGFGCWVVEDRVSGRFVGEVGFLEAKRDVVPSWEGTPEAAWVLAPWAHGRGLATEAVAAVLAWGDSRFAPPRTVCFIDVDNRASQRVAAKCGYRELLRTSYKGAPVILFER
jgi:RimJ/RimL family protein N-acetyltransferase